MKILGLQSFPPSTPKIAVCNSWRPSWAADRRSPGPYRTHFAFGARTSGSEVYELTDLYWARPSIFYRYLQKTCQVRYLRSRISCRFIESPGVLLSWRIRLHESPAVWAHPIDALTVRGRGTSVTHCTRSSSLSLQHCSWEKIRDNRCPASNRTVPGTSPPPNYCRAIVGTLPFLLRTVGVWAGSVYRHWVLLLIATLLDRTSCVAGGTDALPCGNNWISIGSKFYNRNISRKECLRRQ